MRKKILALILVAALAASMCLTPAMAAKRTYPDAIGNWAEKSIDRWSDCGIITGDDTGMVHPGQYLRRCELATILVRLLGLTQRAPGNTFTDVPSGAWYADAILKCAAAGIMEGYAGLATPEDNITREQAITMIGRALGAQTRSGQSLDKFRDAGDVYDYARGYLTAFAAMGILNGVGDGTRVAPKQNIDRASALTLLDRAIGAYVTTPGVVELKDSNQFVVINVALAGEVTVTGQCAGVLVTSGNRASVKLSRLTADTLKVDSPVKVTLVSNTQIDAIDLNAPGELQIDSTCAVGGINTDDAVKNGVAPVINNQGANKNTNSGSGSSSSGGGGGRYPSQPLPSAAPSASPDPGEIVYSIELDAETVSLTVGETKIVTATVSPAGAEVVYDIAQDTDVVSVVVNGNAVTITALKEGTATVNVKVTNGPSKSIAVTVTAAGQPSATPSDQPGTQPSDQPGTEPSAQPSDQPGTEPSAQPSESPKPEETVYSIELDAETVRLKVGGKQTITATVSPAGAEVVYAVSSDTSVATVVYTVSSDTTVEVTITAVKEGTATVTVGVTNGPSKDIEVKVTAEGPGPDDPPDTPTDDIYTIMVDTTIVGGKVETSANSAKKGDTVTLTVTPGDGCELVSLMVNGSAVAVTDGKYTFTMPAKDVIVTATFKDTTTPVTPPETTYTITVADTIENGTVETSVNTAEKGAQVILTVMPDAGYKLVSLMVNGSAVAVTDGKYTFSMPGQNVTVTATFELKTPEPEEPETVTVTLAVGGKDAEAVEVGLEPSDQVTHNEKDDTYTVTADTVIVVVVEALKDKYGNARDLSDYTITVDTKVIDVSGQKDQAEHKLTSTTAANVTITITVVKKEDPAQPAKLD